jgi:hypothetical protein
MCGIAGVHRTGDAHVPRLGRLVDSLLLGIERRGRDATGLLALGDDGSPWIEKRCVTATRFVRERKPIGADARTVMLHARFATTGHRWSAADAHPQASGRVAVVHNGTIWNADEVFEAFGLARRARVDTEVIAALVDFAGWNQVSDALSILEGGAAVAMVNVDHPREVVLARTSGYPLVFMEQDGVVVWASTEHAIREAWRRTYGRSPRARMVHLGSFSVARVNGTVEVSRYAEEPAKPRAVAALPAGGVPEALPRHEKRRRKRSRRRAAQAHTAPHVPARRAYRPYLEPDEMELRVVDLMREGYGWETAWEMVYEGMDTVLPVWEEDDEAELHAHLLPRRLAVSKSPATLAVERLRW